MTDHERIWLQHPNEADEYTGRLWAEDKVWPDDPEDGEPTEYVRADLYAAALAEIERLRAKYSAYDEQVHAEALAEIERLRSQVHIHALPDGTYTAAATGSPHPLKDHGYD